MKIGAHSLKALLVPMALAAVALPSLGTDISSIRAGRRTHEDRSDHD